MLGLTVPAGSVAGGPGDSIVTPWSVAPTVLTTGTHLTWDTTDETVKSTVADVYVATLVLQATLGF